MPLLQSIILGFIQGLTEFLPISSSGHLLVLPWIFGWKGHPLTFDIILHFATFCAIIIYFRKDWIKILREKLFWYIIMASIPAMIFGGIIVLKGGASFRNPMLIAIMLGVFGLVLYIAESYGKKDKSLKDITWQIALLIGLSQILAIIPGVSRSGITISAAILLGINREGSVRFSFLLGAPIILAATCYGLTDLAGIRDFVSYPVLFAGFFAAFLSSMTAIHFLLKFIKRYPFTVFAVYRLAASAIIVMILLGRG